MSIICPITSGEITRLAKAIYASHQLAFAGCQAKAARAIPPAEVEARWRDANPREREDYRWEAVQVLRTVHAMHLVGKEGSGT